MYAYFTLEILQGKIQLLPQHQDVFFKIVSVYNKYIFLQGKGKIHATFQILLNKIEHMGSTHRLHSFLHFQCNKK